MLITIQYQLKITDFACSRQVPGNDVFHVIRYDNETDKKFQPPEYFRMDNFVDTRDAHKVDIFSFGCCLYFMATYTHLFQDIESKPKVTSKVLN
jgi:serine/threonine protein kinase